MRLGPPAGRGAVVAVSALGALAIVGGVTVVVTHHSATTSQNVAGQPANVPPPHLRLAGLHHQRVSYTQPLRLRVRNAAFSAVTVKQPDGTPLPGGFNQTRTEWRSAASLTPLTRLSASVSYVDLDHHTTTRTMAVRTTDSKQHLTGLLSPGGGGKVGIGSPVIVSFNHPVPEADRAAVERRLTVTTSPSVVGAWHWMSDAEIHWRPPTYWKPGTRVTLASDLTGLRISKQLWGSPGRHSTSFTIGPGHISEADVATHEMRVYDGGRLLRTIPISAGRTQYPTKNGVHITFEKSPSVVMDSATVGIPKGSSGYYHETVYWDVRISYGGAFVHAAPWSVADQGISNVSHGCINISPANAQWFYNWSQRGDIVDVVNSSAPVDTADPGMSDWNMTWRQWLAGDAAPTAAAKRLHPALPHQAEPGYGPVRHHAAHAHHAAKHRSRQH